MEMSKLLPNTTQIPNIILDDWLPRLKDCEFKILVVVTRQTLGWVMDDSSGRRKERDWLSTKQLEQRTGCGNRSITYALKTLIEDFHLIEATDKSGNILDTGEKRRDNRSQIFYRLTLKEPEQTLFDQPRRPQKMRTENSRPQILRTQNMHTTKETNITKATFPSDDGDKGVEKVKPQPKQRTDHSLMVEFFYNAVKGTRGIDYIVTPVDVNMLKRVLDRGVKREVLEQAAIYFLSDPAFREFSPTLKTLLSAGIITGIQNKMANGADFWKRLDQYSSRRGLQTAIAGDPRKIAESTARFIELRDALTKSLSMPR